MQCYQEIKKNNFIGKKIWIIEKMKLFLRNYFLMMSEQVRKILLNKTFNFSIDFEKHSGACLVEKNFLIDYIHFLKHDSSLYFDMLLCISSIDKPNHFELFYNFYSILRKFHLTVVLELEKSAAEVESITGLYSSAEWHEREVYDMMGIKFKNHPDLRRILLPNDWEGYPLLKNYQTQSYYHGIEVKY